MADNNEQSTSDSEAAEPKTSIFDLFEPPPEHDPSSFGKIPVIKEDEIDLTDGSSAEVKAAADAEAAGLQHWTAPPTGQVPAVLGSDKDEKGLWADVKGPSWHGDDPSWAGPDLADVFADTESVNLDASQDEYDEDDEYDEESYESISVRPARPVSPPKAAPATQEQPPAPLAKPAPAPAGSGTAAAAIPAPGPSARPNRSAAAAETRPAPGTAPDTRPAPAPNAGSGPVAGRDVASGRAQGRGPGSAPAPGRPGESGSAFGRDADPRPASGRATGSGPVLGRDPGSAPAPGRDADARPAPGRGAGAGSALGRDADARPAPGSDAGSGQAGGRGAGSGPILGRETDSDPARGRGADARPAPERAAGRMPPPGSANRPAAALPPAPAAPPAPQRASVFDDETRIAPPPDRPRSAPRPQPETGPESRPAVRRTEPPQRQAIQPPPRRPGSERQGGGSEHPPLLRADDPTGSPRPEAPSRSPRNDGPSRSPLRQEPAPHPDGAPTPRSERTLSGALADARFEREAPGPARQQHEPNIDDIEFADDGYYEDEEDDFGLGRTGGRNIPQAIGVGLALAGLVLAAMWFGPYTTMLVVVVMALLAVLELYNAMRMAGLRPATLLGIVGTVAAPAAAYYRGDSAFPLIVALAVVFGTLWYLVGADTERPVLNLSLTMMGIFWVGGLAAFAALMVREDGGIELLLATIIITVASDTMAYIGGRAYGSRPFHHASPNKTWEGTITGFLGAVFAGFAIGVTEMGTIWDTKLVPAIVLGAVVGCLAPMGDLAESVVKRDLGVKDMGTLLPGHGGVLDRLDGLLFALPGAYYLALVYSLI